MGLEDLEKRIQTLEDIEAIKKLKAVCSYCVDRHDANGFADLFVEDGIFIGAFQRRDGLEELRTVEFWPFQVHYAMNPIIELKGAQATGKWYFLRPYVDQKGEACWAGGLYDDKYVKVGGVWKFKEIKITNLFAAPHSKGWAS